MKLSTQLTTILTLTFVFGILVLGCGPSLVTLRNPGPNLIANETQPDTIRGAIIRSLERRRFTPEGEEEGSITARLEQGESMLRVNIQYTGTQFAIEYVDSSGMGYQTGPDGQPQIDSDFNEHVSMLTRLIQQELQRPSQVGPSAERGGNIPFQAETVQIVTGNVEAGAVRDAIVTAMRARRFTPQQTEDGTITAQMQHGANMLRVNVTYSGEQYSITYVDSQGLDYQEGPQGATINALYTRYVQGLVQTIQTELERPSREAAKVARRNRRAKRRSERRERMMEIERMNRQAQERQAERQHELDLARAEAEANRPIIIGNQQPTVVTGLSFDANAAVNTYSSNVLRFAPGFLPDPHTTNGVAGGPQTSANLGIPNSCPGNFAAQPNHILVIDNGFQYLRIEALSQGDPTLVIVTPNGTVWCDDDSAGNLNSRIEGSFPSGTYAIYVGNYRAGNIRYQLQVTEYRPQAQANAPVAVAAPQPPQQTGTQMCREALLSSGGHPSFIDRCNGVNGRCAVALIQSGGHPSFLSRCQGVNPVCAEALFQNNHHPSFLDRCRNVDGGCAQALLNSGNHPSFLSRCQQ